MKSPKLEVDRGDLNVEAEAEEVSFEESLRPCCVAAGLPMRPRSSIRPCVTPNVHTGACALTDCAWLATCRV